MAIAKKMMPEIVCCGDPYEACAGVDALVIMTEWNQYRALDLDKLGEIMKGKIFIDLRNIYDPKTLKEKGFKYFGVGRG